MTSVEQLVNCGNPGCLYGRFVMVPVASGTVLRPGGMLLDFFLLRMTLLFPKGKLKDCPLSPIPCFLVYIIEHFFSSLKHFYDHIKPVITPVKISKTVLLMTTEWN